VLGIGAVNLNFDGSGVNITTGTGAVSGGRIGVFSRNRSGGEINITTNGDVSGETDFGINAFTFENGTNLNITTGGMTTGGMDGIWAGNGGSGELVITTNGEVTGTNRNGIHAFNRTTATSISVTTNAAVQGGVYGILVDNQGTAGIELSINADVTGSADDGITVYNSANDETASVVLNQTAESTITGAIDGVYIENAGGSVTVNAEGAINGLGGSGLAVENLETGTSVDVTANNVSGTLDGVGVNNLGTEGTTVTTNGTVTGDTGYGIGVRNANGSLTITANGAVTGGDDGVRAVNDGSGGLSITTADVTGGDDGIFARNNNGGALTISAGAVTGTADEGIDAINDATGTDLSVTTTGAVSGGDVGIEAVNNGTGDLNIKTAAVAGATGEGIYANNTSGNDLNITSTGIVTGAGHGIHALNSGTGGISITTTGDVVGDSDSNDHGDIRGAGIYAVASSTTTEGVTIETSGSITGTSSYGIRVRNQGGGSTAITTHGAVEGNGGWYDGIMATNENWAATADLTVTAHDTVSGGFAGIFARNFGAGVINVTTGEGAISGGRFGIAAMNPNFDGAGLNITTGTGAVSGGVAGIKARNRSTGDITIIANGDVSGGRSDGVNAFNFGNGVNLNITTNGTATGARHGIFAGSMGSGAVGITANGEVTGTTGNGIHAFSLSGTDLGVTTTAAVTGAIDGILASNGGTGQLSVTTSAAVTGGTGFGINTRTGAGKHGQITLNSGAVVSAESGQAISNDAGDVTVLVNDGATVAGSIVLGDGSDMLVFSDSADFSAVTMFDGGDDADSADGFVDTLGFSGTGTDSLVGATVVNWENVVISNGANLSFSDYQLTAGTLTVAGSGVLDASGGDFNLTGNLDNSGTVDLQDGATGDVLSLSGNHNSAGGNLLVDVDFSTGMSDQLVIAGETNGLGTVDINVSDISGGFAAGGNIMLVDVAGASVANAFTMSSGPLVAGILNYDLEQQGRDWYLANSGFNATGAVYESIASNLLQFSSLPSMSQRTKQRMGGFANSDLVTRSGGRAGSGKQVWVRVSGSVLNSVSTSTTTGILAQDHKAWGLETGVDFQTDTGLTFGILAHVGRVSTTVVNALGTGRIDSQGYGLGVTANWQNDTGFYVDAQMRFTKIDSDARSSTNGHILNDFDSSSYAVSIEAGRSFQVGKGTLTPQAQLTWGRVNGGTLTDLFGNVAVISAETSLIGRLGVSYELSNSSDESFYMFGNLLHDFSGSTTVVTNGFSLGNETEKTWLEIGAGGSYALSDKATVYTEVSYKTTGGSSSSAGLSMSGGVSFNW